MFILLKALYKFNEIPIKILMAFFTKIEKNSMYMETKGAQIAKAILSKNKTEGITQLNSKR